MNRLITFGLLLLMACSESTIEPDFQRTGEEYFPLQVGRYSIYNVESIEFDILGTVDTAVFQLKSEVVDSFASQSGDITYIIHRHTRNTASDPWEFQRAWSAYLNSNQAVLIEENIPFLKITFPIENERQWDGNKLNTLEQDDYLLDSLGATYVTPNDTIDNTLTIIQSDNQDFIIQQDKRVEIYGLDIGLVYKQSLLLNYCADPDCIGLEEVESGFSYKQELVEHGKM